MWKLIFSGLIGALLQAAGTFVGRILLSLGIGLAVFTGVDASITWARELAITNLTSMGGNTVRAIGALKVGTCVSILTSAYTARLILNGLTGGTIKKWTGK